MGINALLDSPLSGGSAPTVVASGGTPPGASGIVTTGTASGGTVNSGYPVSTGPGSPGPGAIYNADVPLRFQIAINGHGYIVAIGGQDGYQRTTIPVVRQSRDQSVETGEQTLNSEGLWRRSQENFVLGAGQYYLDEQASLYSLYERAGENQSLRYRFWQSKGVNIWTSGQMTLLNQTEEKLAIPTANLECFQVGDYLYWVNGTDLAFSLTPQAIPAGFAFQQANLQATNAQPITNVTTDGFNVWATCGTNGVWKTTRGSVTGGTQATTAGQTPDNLGYANGRLLTSTGPSVDELNLDGTFTHVGSHSNASWLWHFFTGSPGAVYLGGSSGHVGEIYATTIESDTTTLSPPNLVAPLPPGEICTCMVFNGGFMALGTTVGIRIADISSATSNGLTYGPVIDIQWGINAMVAWGEFVYFSWTDLSSPQALDPTNTELTTGLGRIDLGRFTAALVPAYNTDLQAPTAVQGPVTSVCIINDLPYFTVGGAGLFGQNQYYVEAGYFQSGWMRYGTVEEKTLASIDYRHDPLVGAVGAFVLLEDGTNSLMPESNIQGTLGPDTPFSTNLLAGEKFQTHVYITPSGDLLTTPILRRYTMRALVTPKRMDEIIVPIIMAERVNSIEVDGETEYFDTLAEFQFLKNLESSGTIITYQEGNSAYRAYVDRVQVKPTSWTSEREFFNGQLILRLLTVPAD